MARRIPRPDLMPVQSYDNDWPPRGQHVLKNVRPVGRIATTQNVRPPQPQRRELARPPKRGKPIQMSHTGMAPMGALPPGSRPPVQGFPKPKTPFLERHSTIFGFTTAATAIATFAIGSIGLPGFLDWFTTREHTNIEVPPPVGRVDRYAALVTGTAESDFPITGEIDCTGVGGLTIEQEWHAVATVANEIGSFTVNASADRSQVTINLEQPPELDSGLQLDRTKTDSNESSFFTACGPDQMFDVTRAMMRTSQAAADTIGDCIIRKPEFQQGLHDQMVAFGQEAYPGALVTVNLPQPDGTPSESVSALEALRQELREDGVSIESGPVDNCEFREFTMIPIVYNVGEPN